MRRAWGLVAAVSAASTYASLYVVALASQPIRSGAAAARSDPALAAWRLFGYFVDLSSSEEYFVETRGWVWLPRLVLAVALVTSVHLATRAIATGRPRVAVAQAGAVLLAAGVADLVGLVVVVARGGERSSTVARTLAGSSVFWTYDAVFFGFLCAFVVVSAFLFQRLAWSLLGRPWDALADPPAPEDGERAPTGNLALACSLPVVALALLGGAFAYSGKPANEIRLVDEVAGVVLHPRLQLRPQVDPEAGFDMVVSADRWVPGSVSAVLSVLLVWLLLRWALAGLRPNAGWAAVLVVVWGAVVVASTLGGIAETVIVDSHWVPVVPHATRFGVLWGWLPAVIALVALRRRRLAR